MSWNPGLAIDPCATKADLKDTTSPRLNVPKGPSIIPLPRYKQQVWKGIWHALETYRGRAKTHTVKGQSYTVTPHLLWLTATRPVLTKVNG